MKIAQNLILASIALIGLNLSFNQSLSELLVATARAEPTLPAVAESLKTNALLKRLVASYKALRQAEADYQSQQQLGLLSEVEAIDFSDYLSQLRMQVGKDCAALMATGYEVAQQPLCTGYAAAPVPLTDNRVREQTRAEQVGEQHDQLGQQLGEFDEMMLREQARLKATTPPSDSAQASGQAGAQAGEAGQTDLAGGEKHSSGQASGDDKQQGEVATWAEPGPGSGAAQAGDKLSFPPPADTPNGSDDDLVARQLREAAEQETDPVLRAKLWDEYKKYKQGI